MFNWKSFLSSRNIEYVERGRNVSKGNIGIRCPLCADDPSHHLNISLQGKGWACWREASHRGRNDAKLVKALIGCTWEEAFEITGGKPDVQTTDELLEKCLAWQRGWKPKSKSIEFPKEFRPLAGKDNVFRRPVMEYMKGRGYSGYDVENLAKRYHLHYAINGPWSRRVLVPIYNEGGQLVNYTGRAVGDQSARYKTLGGTEAGSPMSSCLFDCPCVFKIPGRVLVVTEGPFDAMRLNWIGGLFGIQATCIFKLRLSEDQESLLSRARFLYEEAYVMFDSAAKLQSFRAADQLRFRNFNLPDKVKDPGSLKASEALAICRSLVSL